MRRLTILPVVASLVMAGCGGGDEVDEVVADAVADAETPTETVTVDATPTTNGGELTPCTEVASIEVSVDGGLAGSANPDEAVLSVLLDYGAAHPDTFGGLWIDRDAGGALVLAFTDDPAPHRDAIADQLPSADAAASIEIVQVRYTEAKLNALQVSLQPLFDETGLVASGVSVDTNRVTVELLDPTPELVARIAGLIPADAVCAEITLTPPRPDGPLEVIPVAGSDPLVSCNLGPSFPYSVWLDPPLLDDLDHPAADAIREELANPGPETPQVADAGAPWVVLALDDSTALFTSIGENVMSTITFSNDGSGWRWSGSSSGAPCQPAVVLPEGLGRANVTLDPAFGTPEPADSTLHLLVTEQACSSGEEPGDRLLEPQVIETATEVLVAFAVIVQLGPQECPGVLPTPVVVELAEPLGDRVVADGLTVPPRPLGVGEGL
jgi:hypothetical protein